jgi:uncharacterized protein
MRRWLLLCLFCLLPFMVAAAVPAEIAVPPLKARVTDLTGTLTAEQQAALEARLADFEAKKGSQIAVLMVPTTQPEDIAQYSMRVVEAWKLGRKGVDDGALLLVAKNDRKMRIEVGYGLEGVLPDAIAKRIVADVMAPHFRQGDFYGGIAVGVDRMIAVVEGEALPEPRQRAARGRSVENFIPVVLIGALVVGALLRAVLGKFVGGALNGGLVGLVIWLLGGGLIFALALALMAFMMTLGGGRGFPGGFGTGGFGGLGGGGFSGSGGGFGGGGASGDW